MEQRLQACVADIRARTDFVPQIALVLGSGLGNYAERIQQVEAVDYQDLSGFPTSTVAGHRGRFVFGYVQDVPVVVMQGRVHYYEGYAMQEVVLPIRLMGKLGAKTLFLTNASGGINTSFAAGDFMLMTDQIASFVPSPLVGENLDALGPRFPDMSDIYSRTLQEQIRRAAAEQAIALQEGVYLQTTGPQYETPAEIRMFRAIGADAVGMSTACEAIAARHMGLQVCGISCISNMASGITQTPLSHAEVNAVADRAAPKFERLVTASILKIAQ